MSATHLQPTTVSFLAYRAQFELKQLKGEIEDAEYSHTVMKDRVAQQDWVPGRTPEEHEKAVLFWQQRIEMLRACLPEKQAMYDRWWPRKEAGNVYSP